MGILDVFKKKDNRVNYDFGDDDRTQSLAIRQYKREVVALQREIELMRLKRHLAELKESISVDKSEDSDDSMNIDSIFDRILKLAEMNKNQNVLKEMTDSEIEKLIKDTPKEYLKKAKKMSNEEIKVILKQQLPGYSENSYDKAIEKIKK